MIVRFTGLAALIAGIALLLGTLLVGGARVNGFDVNSYTLPVFYVLALIGVVGIHIRQMGVRPSLAWAAAIAASAGLVIGISSVGLSLVGGGIPNSDLGLLQAIGLWLGSAALGASILVIGVLPRAVGLAFVVGSVLAMIGPVAGDSLTSSDLLTALSRSGVAIYALGWVAAGISLLATRPEPTLTRSPA